MKLVGRFARQSDAERDLIAELAAAVGRPRQRRARILNIGAGKNAIIEEALAKAGADFTCDRVDISDCRAEQANICNCWTCPAESMKPAPDGQYDAALANFVLEHVRDIRAAAAEISRVLAAGGVFVATLPNPAAPEFAVARRIPPGFRDILAGKKPFETHYSYSTIPGLLAIFASAGLRTVRVRYSCCTADYLAHLPLVNLVAQLYERGVRRVHAIRLMGHACIVMEKPA